MKPWYAVWPTVLWLLKSPVAWGVGIVGVSAIFSPPPDRVQAEPGADPLTDTNPPMILPDREMAVMECLTCHPIEQPDMNHPVNVPAPKHMPSFMPTQSGQITCITCHQSSVQAHGRSRQMHDGLLRGSITGQAFCSNCHVSDEETETPHALAAGRAHLTWAADSQNVALAETLSPTMLGTQSCLSCHDGTKGKTSGNSHPVMIPYVKSNPAYRAHSSRRRLTPQTQLDARVRLFDGQVGCGSCHSPYSSLPKQLVMTNHDSQLCRSCHQGY